MNKRANAIEQVRDERKRVVILLSDTVEAAIVHSQVGGTVFLLDKKDGDAGWGLRARFSSRKLQRASCSISYSEYIGPNGRVVPFTRTMLWSYG